VIELKTGYDPQTVLDLLYRFTPMEDSFGINNVALVDGRPQTLGLKDMLGVYLAHRIVVTRRRSENRLGKKQARLHLVEGLLIAIVSIDEVIQVIRASDEVEQARQKLMKVFDLSELQAEYILELRLRRLTKFSKIELETEKEALQKEIKALKKILGSDTELREVVSNELEEVAKKYGDDRRTTLMSTFEEVKPISNAKAATMSAQLADTPCVVVFTSSGMVGKTSVWDTTAAAPAKRKKHDAIKTVIATTTRSDIGFITTNGVMHRIHVGDVPALSDVFDLGSMVAANSFLGLPKSEKVLNVFELNDEINIAMGTAKGIVKRLSADFAPKAEFEVIALKPGDKLIGANLVENEDEIVFVTNDAQLLRFKASVLNAQGRGAAGIAGINLSDSEVVSFSVVKPENENVVITAASSTGSLAGTDAGSVKITALSEFPAKGRATGGVRAHKFLRNEDEIYFAWAGPSEAIALTADGKPTELPEGQAKRDASGTKSPGIIGSVGHRLN
jgi:DNA gyrase subunit A